MQPSFVFGQFAVDSSVKLISNNLPESWIESVLLKSFSIEVGRSRHGSGSWQICKTYQHWLRKAFLTRQLEKQINRMIFYRSALHIRQFFFRTMFRGYLFSESYATFQNASGQIPMFCGKIKESKIKDSESVKQEYNFYQALWTVWLDAVCMHYLRNYHNRKREGW